MEEIWKPIKNFEGYYEVSNLGRVRGIDRYITYSDGRKYLYKGKILTPQDNGHGYLFLMLKNFHFYIHRLVAQTFLPNPDNLPQVNHKDENPYNNNVENLEWVTQEQNNIYGTRLQKIYDARVKTGSYSGTYNEGYQKYKDYYKKWHKEHKEQTKEYNRRCRERKKLQTA